MLAAKRQADTGEREHNPHEQGSDAHRRWNVCFERALQMQTASEDIEGGC
jgi:hypothetical protein